MPARGRSVTERSEDLDDPTHLREDPTMYEQFGGLVDQETKTVTFRLFLPDHEKAPFQYEGGGLPRITDVFVVGSFQKPAWDFGSPRSEERRVGEEWRAGMARED